MELWDIYDIDRVRTGRVAQRGKPASEGGLGEGEYHLVVHICVFNGRGQLLLQQRQKDKEGYPNLWDVSAAGSALARQRLNMEAKQRCCRFPRAARGAGACP